MSYLSIINMQITNIVDAVRQAASPTEIVEALAPLELSAEELSSIVFYSKDDILKLAFALYIKKL